MNTRPALDPGTVIDADTIRHRANRLTRAALVAMVADVALSTFVTAHHLERAGVSGRDLKTLLADEQLHRPDALENQHAALGSVVMRGCKRRVIVTGLAERGTSHLPSADRPTVGYVSRSENTGLDLTCDPRP